MKKVVSGRGGLYYCALYTNIESEILLIPWLDDVLFDSVHL